MHTYTPEISEFCFELAQRYQLQRLDRWNNLRPARAPTKAANSRIPPAQCCSAIIDVDYSMDWPGGGVTDVLNMGGIREHVEGTHVVTSA